MKKSITTASPFLMLLVPVFFCMALLSFGKDDAASDMTTANQVHVPAIKVPTIQTMVKAIF